MRWFPVRRRASPAPPPAFDAAGYASTYPDISATLGRDAAKLYRHWTEWGHLENRTPFGLAPYKARRFGRGFWRRAAAVTMYGFFEAPSGIGAAARAYRAALEGAGYPVTAVTLVEDGPRLETLPDLRPRPAGLLRPLRLPPGARENRVNVFVLNADSVHRFFLDGRTALLDDSYNIGIWFWELAHFPAGWQAAFGAFDEIWVASEFCREAIAAVAPVPVVVVPMPVLPFEGEGALLPRSHFGLPDGVFLFGCTFDIGSVVRRKNPLAAVEAFLAGFGGRSDAMLVLKYHGTHHYPESVGPLLEAVAGHANIRLVDRTFDAREAASFRATLDCLVSPHRSEGFGLNLAEAMLAGRPVVATGYSGNTDFMGPGEGVSLAYRLTDVGEGAWPYPPSALWAEPDAAELAAAMRDVAADRATAGFLAGRARSRIGWRHSVEAAASVLRERLDPVLQRRSEQGPPPAWGGGRHAATAYRDGDGPRLAVVAPPSGLSADRLPGLVAAMNAQTYGDWELVLVDEPGISADARAAMSRVRGRDPRIKVSIGPITKRIDDVLAMMSARHVVLLGEGEPSPTALAEIASMVGRGGAQPLGGRDRLACVSRARLLEDGDALYRFAALADLAASRA